MKKIIINQYIINGKSSVNKCKCVESAHDK